MKAKLPRKRKKLYINDNSRSEYHKERNYLRLENERWGNYPRFMDGQYYVKAFSRKNY